MGRQIIHFSEWFSVIKYYFVQCKVYDGCNGFFSTKLAFMKIKSIGFN